jgi:hypothetical protein
VHHVVMQELDDNVGKVLAELDKLGIADNTIVVFTSDNGLGTMTWPDGGTTPFHGEKGTMWEGGFRVPAISCAGRDRKMNSMRHFCLIYVVTRMRERRKSLAFILAGWATRCGPSVLRSILFNSMLSRFSNSRGGVLILPIKRQYRRRRPVTMAWRNGACWLPETRMALR